MTTDIAALAARLKRLEGADPQKLISDVEE